MGKIRYEWWDEVFYAIREYLKETGFEIKCRRRLIRVDGPKGNICIYLEEDNGPVLVGHERCIRPTFEIDMNDPRSFEQISDLINTGAGYNKTKE